MSEVASLELKVTSDGVATADRRLKDMAGTAQKTERATDGLSTSIKNLALQYVGVATAVASLRKLIDTNREFEKLNAGLITATGSAEDAALAFDVLQKFASETPFSLRETTDAFTMLVNRGLDPSERSMTALGNIVASSKYTFVEMVEAVANATAGEMDNLKKFGIKAEQEGNRISFTFQGVRTTVQRTTKDIQNYFTNLGEKNFFGSMANRMQTLDGAMSNLGDSWDKLMVSIGKTGIGKLIEDNFRAATEAVELLSTSLGAGGLSGALASAQIGVVYIVTGMDAIITSAKLANSAFAALTNPSRWVEVVDQTKGLRGELDRIRIAGLATIDEIQARLARQRAEEGKEKKKGALGDYGKGADESGLTQSQMDQLDAIEAKKRKERAAKGFEIKVERGRDSDFVARMKEREQELTDMMDRDEKIRQEEERRRQQEAQDLQERANRAEELAAIYRTEEEELFASHDRRRRAIEDAAREEVLSEQQKNEMLRQEDAKHERDKAEFRAAQNDLALGAASATFGSLSAIAKQYGGEQNATYQTMFAVSKAFAAAQAAVSIATGSAKALELGWPAGIVAGLQVAATGAQLLATIAGANYAGAYDLGGSIPAGKWGIAGERGPEIVQGPATVTSRADTAAIRGGQPIQIINAPNTAAASQWARSASGRRVILNVIKEERATIRTLTR